MSPRPIRKDEAPQGRCERCGKTYPLKQYYQRYCSTRCRMTAYWKRRLAKEEK